MSGFTNITGFAPPSSIAGFMGLLQTAMFRGVPFKVIAARVKKGRRWAIHEYPYVDGGWAEDMGRSLRTYSFSGYLIGDLAPVMQNLLDMAIEAEGSGLLMHPTIGAIRVGVISASTAVHRDHMRVIEIHFEFVEAGSDSLIGRIIATVISVLAAASSSLTSSGNSMSAVAVPVAGTGPAVTAEAAAVVAGFASAVTTSGANPTAIVGIATALPPPSPEMTYGRYGAGSASVMLPDGTTVASLQAQLANQRATLAQAGAAAVAAALSYSAVTDMLGALAALVEAMRAGITDPADQVRVLLGLAGFSFHDAAGGAIGVGAAMATMRDAMAAACRRTALASLARASAAYQPTSYDDAAALRRALSDALDREITAAGDAGEDAAYAGLHALRAAMVRDLTVRGASLPSVVTVALRQPMPALAIAQMLYRDASRSDEIVAASRAVHPAFCPVSFQTLTSGMAPHVNPMVPVLISKDSCVAIRPGPAPAGPYLSPYPDAPSGLAVGTITASTAALSWTEAPAGKPPTVYVIEVSAHGAGIWSTAGSVAAPGTAGSATGLTSNTAYDFRVTASNTAGPGPASGVMMGTTLAAAPNAAGSLVASAGSPSSSVVGLTWAASAVDGTHDAAVTYTARYGLAASGIWATFGAPIAGTAVNLTGLAFATAYDFDLIATNSGGTATSATVSATTVTAAPNTPTGFAAAAGSPAYSAVNLSWTAPATDGSHGAAASYTASFRLNDTGGWGVAQSGIAGTSVSLSGFAHASLYGFKIDAVNAGGTNAAGATTTRTTDTAAPNAPAITAVHPAYDGTTTKLTATWTAPATDGTHDAATGYDLRWSVAAANTWTTVTGVSSGAVMTGLATGTSYDIQVRGTNASSGSLGAWSGSTTASTYSSTVVWGPSGAPKATAVHDVGNLDGTMNAGTNGTFSVNPPGVNMAASLSNTAIPSTGLVAASYAGSYYNWALYLATPSTAGTYYLWVISSNGTGTLVSGAIVVS